MSKILILTNSAEGLYLFRKELLCALRSDGHTLAVSVPDDNYCEKIEALGCRVLVTDFERRGMNPLKDLQLAGKYWSLLHSEQPDWVFAYTIKPNIYGGAVCRLGRVPYICNITGLGTALENPGLLGRVLLVMYRYAVGRARCVFFQNEKNRGFMKEHGIARGRDRLLPGSGVNLTEHAYTEYPSEQGGIVFLAVMRIMRDKGIGEYLEAARTMKKRHDNVAFWLAGAYEEESRGQYEPLIRKLEGDGVIRYLGHVDNVGEVMAQSHVIVHPSYHEGLSNVLLEAAACGRPVLAGNISGCVETFSEGRSGLSFDIKSADALLGAMERICALSCEERRSMGRAGRAWVEAHFDRELIIEAYRSAIKDRSSY